jgi:hypothetical protein
VGGKKFVVVVFLWNRSMSMGEVQSWRRFRLRLRMAECKSGTDTNNLKCLY